MLDQRYAFKALRDFILYYDTVFSFKVLGAGAWRVQEEPTATFHEVLLALAALS